MLNSFYYDFGARLISLTPTFIIEPVKMRKPPLGGFLLLYSGEFYAILSYERWKSHMMRFFVSPEELSYDIIMLAGENAQHAKVLRIKTGEQVIACDGLVKECLCVVDCADNKEYSLKVLERRESVSEPRVRVSIYMALPKGDKLEHVIQKATELGAYEIVAFPSARCVSKPDEKSLKKKLERWVKIAASAAEQSGRGRVPEVVILPSYKAALEHAVQADRAILFYENEQSTTLRMVLEEGVFDSISLLSGPEGGLEPREVQMALDAGIRVCTLGKRILRCETAPLCALSAVMYASGEF